MRNLIFLFETSRVLKNSVARKKYVTLRSSKGEKPFKQGAYFENLSMTSKKNLITVSFPSYLMVLPPQSVLLPLLTTNSLSP